MRGIVARVGLTLALLGGCREARDAQPSQAVALAPAEIHSAADKGLVAPGEPVLFRVEVEYNPDVQVEIDEPDAAWGGMQCKGREATKVRRVEGRLRRGLHYTLHAERPGSYVLPAAHASFALPGHKKQPMSSAPVYVRVAAADDPPPPELRDLKAIERLSFYRRRPWAWAVAAVALLLALATLWLWWRRRRATPKVAPSLPPHEVALAALDRLQRQTPPLDQAMRQAAFAASEIVRVYVEARFPLHATYMTTEEIFGRLAALVELQPEEQRRLKEFLAQTDTIKYAGMVPDAQQLLAMFDRARRFVQSTIEAATPPPSAAAGPPPLPLTPPRQPPEGGA